MLSSASSYLHRDAQGAVGQSESHGGELEGRAGKGTRGERVKREREFVFFSWKG